MFKKKLYFLLVGLELGIISLLCVTVRSQQEQILESSNVSILKKENFSSSNAQYPLKYFYESRPNQIIEEQPAWLEEKVIYTINSQGFNQMYDYPFQKPVNTFRILTLGDSFTFGQNVNTPNNWPSVLEHFLNTSVKCEASLRFEVINLGESGYDVAYVAHRFELRGKSYNPDLIIWLESGTGFNRFNELMSPLQQQYQTDLKSTNPTINPGQFKDIYERATRDIHTHYKQEDLDKLVDQAWKNFFTLRSDVRTIIMLYQEEEESNLNRLKAIAEDFSAVYIVNAIPYRNDKLYTFPDGHPNLEGHKLIARIVASYMLEKKMMPCISIIQ